MKDPLMLETLIEAEVVLAGERKKRQSQLWNKAMAALARREHSEYELDQKFRKLDAPFQEDNLIESVIAALKKDDLISNERFAMMLCRSRYQKGIGPVRLVHELEKHQIEAHWQEAALLEFAGKWRGKLQEVHERKYGKSPPEDYKAWAKRARFLQQRGFSAEQIREVVQF